MSDETTVFADFVIRSAQVFDEDRFVFLVDRKLPDTWQTGDPGVENFSVRHDARRGEWTWDEIKAGLSSASATGPGVDGARESVFVTSPDFHSSVLVFRFETAPNGPDHKLDIRQIVTAYGAAHIDGALCICGDQQTVLRRVGPQEYERLHFKKGGRKLRTHEDWYAIGGYGTNDIYVTGKDIGQGSLFHFDGIDWTPLRLPREVSEFQGRALICTPDGTVYAAALNGALVRGNARDGFEVVVYPADSDIAEIFGPHAMAWFKGKLYVSTLSWLYTPVDGKWEPVKAEKGFQPLSFKGLATNGEVLLQYGEFGATLFDGDIWSRVYAPYSIEDLVRAEGLQQQLDKVGEGIDILRAIRSRQP